MNKVIMMGRLTRDPEIRYSQSSNPIAIARFSIAVDRRYKREGEAEADFFDCTSFGKQAEFVEKYLFKGSKIAIVGILENNNYTNKDGQKVYAIRVVCEEIEFAESKAASQQNRQAQQPAQSNDGFMDFDMDDVEELPF